MAIFKIINFLNLNLKSCEVETWKKTNLTQYSSEVLYFKLQYSLIQMIGLFFFLNAEKSLRCLIKIYIIYKYGFEKWYPCEITVNLDIE